MAPALVPLPLAVRLLLLAAPLILGPLALAVRLLLLAAPLILGPVPLPVAPVV